MSNYTRNLRTDGAGFFFVCFCFKKKCDKKSQYITLLFQYISERVRTTDINTSIQNPLYGTLASAHAKKWNVANFLVDTSIIGLRAFPSAAVLVRAPGGLGNQLC